MVGITVLHAQSLKEDRPTVEDVPVKQLELRYALLGNKQADQFEMTKRRN